MVRKNEALEATIKGLSTGAWRRAPALENQAGGPPAAPLVGAAGSDSAGRAK
jgi:hypothetical protein